MFHLLVELDRMQQDVLDDVQAVHHISPRHDEMPIGEAAVVLAVWEPNRAAVQDGQRRVRAEPDEVRPRNHEAVVAIEDVVLLQAV